VLLASADFLASDFIYDRELPALREADEAGLLRFVCVPVSPGDFEDSGLTGYQWPRPPDEPLDLLPDAEQKKELTRIARVIRDRFVSLAPEEPKPEGRPASSAIVGPIAAPAEATDRMGTLHGVPNLPEEYVPRPTELARIRDTLLNSNRPSVGLIGPSPVGVQGMGGVGKTVLASALVREQAVRKAFPDGVFWLTLGQDPDVLALMNQLGDWVGIGTSFDTAGHARDGLAEAFKDSACLLVLDDVWRAADARVFDLLGGRSRESWKSSGLTGRRSSY
jgi:hypothetical protein